MAAALALDTSARRSFLMATALALDTSGWTLGVDVSAWQRWTRVDWEAAYAHGARFAWIKACEGVRPDSRFAQHWGHAREAGFLRGAYAFADVRLSPRTQAETLDALLREHGSGELPPAIDIESAHERTALDITDHVCAWVDHVHASDGRRPVVYTYSRFAHEHLRAERLAECPLWIAHYGVRSPVVPAAWGAWSVWQFTGAGQVPGIRGRVDLNWYRGDLYTLREWGAYGR